MKSAELQPSTQAAGEAALPSPAVSDGGTAILKPSAEIGLQLYKSDTSLDRIECTYSCASQPHIHNHVSAAPPSLTFTLLPSFFSAVLVVVGWYVVNKAQSNRERRKQIREYISDLCDDLEEIETLAITYHTTGREEEKEQEIISKLGRFEKACSMLPRFTKSQKYLKAVPESKLAVDGKLLQVLRKAMTLEHFGDEHSGALSRRDAHIQKLELASDEVQEALEKMRVDSLD
jgi:hypothetical protein